MSTCTPSISAPSRHPFGIVAFVSLLLSHKEMARQPRQSHPPFVFSGSPSPFPYRRPLSRLVGLSHLFLVPFPLQSSHLSISPSFSRSVVRHLIASSSRPLPAPIALHLIPRLVLRSVPSHSLDDVDKDQERHPQCTKVSVGHPIFR